MNPPEEYKAKYDTARQQNKGVVFDALDAAGITTVTVEFDGYGDGGQIEGITAQDGGSAVELPKTAVTVRVFSDGRCADHSETIEMLRQLPLAEAIEDLCYDCLEERYAGWELNEGSFGRFEFNVIGRAIRLEFNQRVDEIVTDFHDF